MFIGIIDQNNNGTIDSIEDNFEPQYEYGIDRQGYHLEAAYNLLDNLTIHFGWLNESEISSRRRNNSKYVHVIYQRDIPTLAAFFYKIDMYECRMIYRIIVDFRITYTFL